jgi:hypothetical protein
MCLLLAARPIKIAIKCIYIPGVIPLGADVVVTPVVPGKVDRGSAAAVAGVGTRGSGRFVGNGGFVPKYINKRRSIHSNYKNRSKTHTQYL